MPKSIIRSICSSAGVPQEADELIYLKEHAMSYFRLKRMLGAKWTFKVADFFISRPIYNIRFGWKVVKSVNIPLFREFSNGCELLLKKEA